MLSNDIFFCVPNLKYSRHLKYRATNCRYSTGSDTMQIAKVYVKGCIWKMWLTSGIQYIVKHGNKGITLPVKRITVGLEGNGLLTVIKVSPRLSFVEILLSYVNMLGMHTICDLRFYMYHNTFFLIFDTYQQYKFAWKFLMNCGISPSPS